MRFFSRRLPENPHLTFIMAFQVQAISSYYGRLTLSGVQSNQLEWLCSAILGVQVSRSYNSLFIHSVFLFPLVIWTALVLVHCLCCVRCCPICVCVLL